MSDTQATTASDWTSSLDPDLKGVVQTKGWKAPADALKSYVNLEKMVGVDKVALPPKGQDGTRDWSKWDGWAAIGRPEAPDKYAFKDPQGYQATETDKAFRSHMAPLLHKAGLAQWQVDVLAEGMGAFTGQHAQQAEANIGQAVERAEQTLRADPQFGGAAFDKNMDLAQRAVRQFLGPEGAKVLADSGAGRDPVIVKAFAKIGAALGEDGHMPRGEHDAGGALAPAAAQAEHAKMQAATFAAQAKGESHPGWDRNHPEFKAFQEKAQRLLFMAYPPDKDAAQKDAIAL